jgi:RHS repeat-associated protein
MNWLVCRFAPRALGAHVIQPQRVEVPLSQRSNTRATSSIFRQVALLILTISASGFFHEAHASSAKWGTVPLTNGHLTYFDTAWQACQWQHQGFSPLTPLYAPIPDFGGYWWQGLCSWPFSPGWSDPTGIELDCVDANGNIDYSAVRVPPGECIGQYEPDVSRSSCTYNEGGTPNPTAGDPVILATGSLFEQVTDYADADGRLSIKRTYRSRAGSTSPSYSPYAFPFGAGDLWRFSFQWEITLNPSNFASLMGVMGITTPDGSRYGFNLNSDGSMSADDSVTDFTVQYVNSGGGQVNYNNILSNGGQFWITTTDGNKILMGLFIPWWDTGPGTTGTGRGPSYIAGRPLQIVYRGGYTWNLGYGAQGELQSITDNLGRSVTVSWYYGTVYDASTTLPRAVQQITLPDGTTLNYTYESLTGTQGDSDGFARLKTFTRSKNSTTADSATYLYTDPNSRVLLSGVSDNAGIQYNTWQYDSYGRVTYASHSGGADAISVAYALNTSTFQSTRTVTNPLGEQTVYTFQGSYYNAADPLLITVTGIPTATCIGTTVSFRYDGHNRKISTVDANGNTTNYTYGSDGRVQTMTEAYGTSAQRATQYTWNNTFGVSTQIVQPGITTNLSYDSAGRLTQRQQVDTTPQTVPYSTNGQTRTWIYSYNSSGLLSSLQGPAGVSDTTLYGYSTSGYLSSVTDQLGHTTQYTSIDAGGRPVTIVDPNGVATTLAYDAANRLASRSTAGETTTFSYTTTGMLQRLTLPDASYVQYTYDSARRLTQITDALGNYVTYTLDAMGNRTAESAYSAAGALHRTHARGFDSLGRLYQEVNAAGTAAVTTTLGYDGNGNQTTTAAPLARNTTNAYDALNRLSQVTDPASGVTSFGYDGTDRLTSVSDPRHLVTSYTYSGVGDLIQLVSPDTGTTVSTYSGGNLATSTDARGAVSTYAYDAANRATSVAYKIGSTTDQTITFTYDSGTNGIGHLTGASDANHAIAWTYDGLGRVTGKSEIVGAVNLSVGYGFTNGDMTALITPSGQAVTYGYNSNHQIVSVTLNGTTVLSGVTYEPFGAVNGWTWGNNTTTTRSFNGDGLISQIVTAGVTLGYSFDNANRITGISDSSNSGLSWTYGYDLLDRLTGATTSAITDGWTYDANGNRLTQTGTTPITFSVNSASNQLTATTGSLVRSYSYDTAGHATGYSTNGFTYNNRGRMAATTASSTNYLYNALGQMIEKSGTPGTTVFMQDETGHLIGEYNGNGSLIEETVWLGDIPVATLQPNGSGGVNIFYVHTDHLNTPRKVARPSDNALEWRWDADPFGTAAPNQNPSGLGTFTYNIRFPGQYYQAETGLSQNYFRDYDPQVGRYVEPDPIGLLGGVNSYAYVNDNPILRVDTLGLRSNGTSLPWPAGSTSSGSGGSYSRCDAKPCDCNEEAEKARKKCLKYFPQPPNHFKCIQKFAANKEACVFWQAAGHIDCPKLDETPD